MKVPEQMYSSNVLRGKDLEDSIVATIKSVDTVTFNEGKDNEREALSVTVESEDLVGAKQFSPNQKNTAVIVGAYTDDTDKWVGKKVRLTPVASQTPDGKPTTSIAVGIPKGSS
jgi:hypothetical protein